jgi:hypothetical protein
MTDHIVECVDSVTQQHAYASIVIPGDFNRLQDDPLCSYLLAQLNHSPMHKKVILD